MNIEIKRKRSAAVLLLAFLCSSSFTGCCHSKGSTSEVTLESTSITAEKEQVVTVGSFCCDVFAKELTLSDANLTELEKLLPLLPQLETLKLEGSLPSSGELLALKEQYPNIELISQITLGGQSVSTDTELLDLSATTVTIQELQELLPLFSNLQELTLTGTTLSDEEKMSLIDSLSSVFVRCELPFAGQRFLTDCTEIDLSNAPVTAEEADRMLPYFPKLTKLDMSFCGISDEEM